MKQTTIFFLALAIIASFFSCKKNEETSTTNYASVKDFFSKNGVKTESFTFNASTGATFTSDKGTVIKIPANAFTLNGNPVTGDLKVDFKDIYTLEDMLLTGMDTRNSEGKIMATGGEFYIDVTSNGVDVDLAFNSVIQVEQPTLGNASVDSSMQTFVLIPNDTISGSNVWLPDTSSSLEFNNQQNNIVNKYIFTIRNLDDMYGGAWYNTDNSSIFEGFTLSTCGLKVKDNQNSSVFLIYDNKRAMLNLYKNASGYYTYDYSPNGMPCTAISLSVRSGKIFASFTSFTTSNNYLFEVEEQEMTEEEFKSKLDQFVK